MHKDLQAIEDLRKSVAKHEHQTLAKKALLDEAKADLAAVRYEIAKLLLDFTKPIPDKDTNNTQKIVTKKLKEVVDQIAAKEAIEEQILSSYYQHQTEYLQNLRVWRKKFVLLAEKEEEFSSPLSQKLRDNPQNASKLIVWDEDAEDRKKEADWKGQLIPFEDLHYSETGFLGAGAFGSVYKGTIYHSPCAIKVLNSRSINAEAREGFKDEVRTLSNLQHDRILRFLGAVLDNEHLCLVTDLAENGSAADKLFPPAASGKKKKRARKEIFYELGPRRKLSIIRGIVEGMTFLHYHNVIHCDLKPENILLDEAFNPIIADFGLTRVFALEDILGLNGNVAGTLWYMAPEILSDHPVQSPKIDVYAFAIIAYEIWLQQRWDWGATTPSKLLERLLGNETTKPYRPPFEGQRASFPADLAYLISKCWESTPNNRPDFFHISKIRHLDKFIERETLRSELKTISDSAKKASITSKITDLSKIVDETDTWMQISISIASAEAGAAAQLWDKICPGSGSMEWGAFQAGFSKATGVDPFKPEEQVILKAAFEIQDEINVVTRQEFIEYCKVFGVKPNITALVELFHEPWYFGRIDAAQSCVVLANEKHEDSSRFLIRQSGRTPGTFAMSIRSRPLNKKQPPQLTHYTLTQIQDYTRLSPAMQNNALLKEVMKKASGWKPADKSTKPAILTNACNKYLRIKKKKSEEPEQTLSFYNATGTALQDSQARLDEFHGGQIG